MRWLKSLLGFGPSTTTANPAEPTPEPPEFTEEEIDTCQRAGVIAGILPNHMMPGANDMGFIVGRLRKLDLAPLLAEDLLRYYGTKPETHKAVEPKPKPASCPRNAGIMPTPHCPCTDRCCFCHYEEQLPSKPTRARRFEFLDSSGIFNGRSLYWNVPQELLREVKPITREQVIDLCNWFEGGGSAGIVAGLHELGIEVED